MLSNIDKIKKEILVELKDEIKKDVLNALLKDKLRLTDDIIDDIDLDDLMEQEIEDSLDLELWVKDVYAIFKTIDESDELSLKTLNDKFGEVMNIIAALVSQIRVIHENIGILDRVVKNSQGYGVLGGLVDKLNQDDTPEKDVDQGMFM